MNILFVSLWPMTTNTSAALRNHALISGLLEQGCEIDVITIAAHEQNPFYDQSLHLHERIRWTVLGANQTYAKMINQSNGFKGKLKKALLPIARRFYHSFNLFDQTKAQAQQIHLRDLPKSSYDMVISSSDPKTSHLAVQRLIKQGLRYGQWIQYWGDPLALDITQKHVYPSFYVKRVEHSLLRDADQIVYVSPFTLEAQKRQFADLAHKMMFLPIPYARTKIYPDVAFREPSRLRLGYFGDYKSTVRNILPLLEVCRAHRQKFELRIAGNTDLQLQSDETIRVWPRLSQTEMEQEEAQCDVLVCLLNARGTQIPGKVYHYAATNKPIIILLDGEQAQAMEQYFSGFARYVCCLNEPVAITETLHRLAQHLPNLQPSPHFAARTIAAAFLARSSHVRGTQSQ